MLTLDVTRMRDGLDRLDRTIEPGALPKEEDYSVVEPVVLSAALTKDKAKVQIDGTARTTLELACSRCLERFRVPVDASFDLLYLPWTEAAGGEQEIEIGDEDINTAYYRDGVIDLRDLLHEQIYLTLPMKPLCREDCKGLCPVCGANRNTTECSCESRWDDPRLAGLKALLNENDDA